MNGEAARLKDGKVCEVLKVNHWKSFVENTLLNSSCHAWVERMMLSWC